MTNVIVRSGIARDVNALGYFGYSYYQENIHEGSGDLTAGTQKAKAVAIGEKRG